MKFMSNQIFDEAEYLAANPDVAAAVEAGNFRSGHHHYELFGKKKGRMLRRFFGKLSRNEKVFYLLNKKGLGLEIGASHHPFAPKRKGYNVHILDHLSSAELREKYAGHAEYGVNIGNIEEVDFVWNGQPLPELIGRTHCYDWIIASHVIEHLPAMWCLLQQCHKLLKSGGILSLVIPDKRYCFDCFNPPSSTGQILDAFEERRTRPSSGQVFDHFANASKRGGHIAWSAGAGGMHELIHTFEQTRSRWQQSRSSKDYIDGHWWRFTPSSFRLLISDLITLDLIDMDIKKEFVTTGHEFYVSLGAKDNNITEWERLAVLKDMKLEMV